MRTEDEIRGRLKQWREVLGGVLKGEETKKNIRLIIEELEWVLQEGKSGKTEDTRIYARSMTKNFLEAYLGKIQKGKFHKNRYDAIKAAWNFFYAFNQPISEEAKKWFEENIGKVDD